MVLDIFHQPYHGWITISLTWAKRETINNKFIWLNYMIEWTWTDDLLHLLLDLLPSPSRKHCKHLAGHPLVLPRDSPCYHHLAPRTSEIRRLFVRHKQPWGFEGFRTNFYKGSRITPQHFPPPNNQEFCAQRGGGGFFLKFLRFMAKKSRFIYLHSGTASHVDIISLWILGMQECPAHCTKHPVSIMSHKYGYFPSFPGYIPGIPCIPSASSF